MPFRLHHVLKWRIRKGVLCSTTGATVLLGPACAQALCCNNLLD